MKNLNFTVLIIFALTVSLYSQNRAPRRVTAKRPVIVTSVETPPVPKLLTLGITFERYATNTDVNADGTATQTLEFVQRFNTETAIAAAAKFERIFNGDLQKVEVLNAQILKADGRKLSVPAASIQIKPTAQAEAAPSFSSLKTVEIKFDDVKAGDAVTVKIRLIKTKPVFPGHFDKVEVFPMVYEWKSIEVSVNAPKDYPLYTQAVDLEGGKIADENGRSRWLWTKKDLPAAEIETAMLDFFESSPKVFITSFKNYEELGAAYWAEAAAKSIVTPEIQKLADDITKNIKEPEAQAYAIYEWANKNVRYLSVVLERGGWIPHDATQIQANRYGDCKDYTTLLNALLKAKNIESYPVIIRADATGWFPEVAVPGFFNHAILYIPSLELFADATAPNTRLGLIPQQIVGKKAFLAGAKTGVIKVPDGKPEDNELLSDVDIVLAEDGSYRSVSKNTYRGRSEILFRPLFTNSQLQKDSGVFIKLMLGYFGIDGTGRILKIANPFKVGEPFELEMAVEQADFTAFSPKGSMRLPTGVNIINMLELEAFVKTEKRRSSLIMGATRIRENFKLRMPAGVTVESLPETIDIKTPLGYFRNEYKSNDGGAAVEVWREFVITKDVVSAAEYPQMRDLINKMVAAFNGEIKYRAAPEVVRANRRRIEKKPPSPGKSFEQLISDEFAVNKTEKVLTRRQIAQLESKLAQNPNDTATRLQILEHYNDYRAKQSPAKTAARFKHRLWFVRNRPEMDDYEILGTFPWSDSSDAADYQALKTEWLKQIAANPNNVQIRLNAVQFMKRSESPAAEKILLEGRKFYPENYELPLALNELYQSRADDSDNAAMPEIISENLLKAFETGDETLILLKTERSEERDEKRRALLTSLSKIALRLGKNDRAKQFSTELILDFGQNSAASGYEEATHTGNIVLGLIALRENDLTKAKQHLLIAIRAPLRDENNYLTDIDTELAEKLFAKGEKTVVSEYLKLCENLGSLKKYPDLYEDKSKALKLWQEQIKQGATPSFDFDKP